MDYAQALILAVVEGLTEFLPVSSTGHLVLTTTLLGIEQTEFVKSFEIIIQLGSILAIIFLYWRTLLLNRSVWKTLFVAFLPTAIIGFTVYRIVKDVLLGNAIVTVIALFLGGIALISIEYFLKKKEGNISDIQKISPKKAMIIGLAQSLAMVPGVSRSAATIIGGTLLGLKRKTAIEFSFLLAVPTMLAATGYDLLKTSFSFTPYEYSVLGVGMIGAFIVAILAVKIFLKYIERHNFIAFGIYRIILSLLFYFFILN